MLWCGMGVFLAILLHKPLDAFSITSLMMVSGWPAVGAARGQPGVCADVSPGRRWRLWSARPNSTWNRHDCWESPWVSRPVSSSASRWGTSCRKSSFINMTGSSYRPRCCWESAWPTPWDCWNRATHTPCMITGRPWFKAPRSTEARPRIRKAATFLGLNTMMRGRRHPILVHCQPPPET